MVLRRFRSNSTIEPRLVKNNDQSCSSSQYEDPCSSSRENGKGRTDGEIAIFVDSALSSGPHPQKTYRPPAWSLSSQGTVDILKACVKFINGCAVGDICPQVREEVSQQLSATLEMMDKQLDNHKHRVEVLEKSGWIQKTFCSHCSSCEAEQGAPGGTGGGGGGEQGSAGASAGATPAGAAGGTSTSNS